MPVGIQPHGALIMFAPDRGIVTQASANLEAILGLPPDAVLGQPLAAAIGEAASSEILRVGLSRGIEFQDTLCIDGPGQERLALRASFKGACASIDIEPMLPAAAQNPSVATLRSLIDSFDFCASQKEVCGRATDGLRAITGFDRVTIIRFNPAGQGEVVAESRSSELQPYLGFNFPAGDLPPPQRLLLMDNVLESVADVNATPVPLQALPGTSDATAPDLDRSNLRCVSALRRRHMRNMKIGASTRIGLVCDGALWGFVSLHHRTPFLVGPGLQAAIAVVAKFVSALLPVSGAAEIRAGRLRLDPTLAALIGKLRAPLALPEAFEAAQTDLLRLLAAAGAAIRVAGALRCFGSTPPLQIVAQMLGTLTPEAQDEILAIENLGHRHGEFSDWTGVASGVLLLPLSSGTDDAILWFRPEQPRILRWAGNPAERVVEEAGTGRRFPLSSFAVWQETLTGHAAGWTETDLLLARKLRTAFMVEAARRTELELAKLRDYDPLTGLPNQKMLQRRLAEAGRSKSGRSALLFIDLSQTKQINETLGYGIGDAVLCELASRLVTTAGPHCLVARRGGAELVILSEGLDSIALGELSERIRQAVELPFEISGHSCQVFPHIRLAVAGERSGESLEDALETLMRAAREAVDLKRSAEAQRQKMEGLGRMAGGIAHEINNLLQPVTLLGQELLDQGLVSEGGCEHVNMILDCGSKTRQIIGDLLAFSRPTSRTMQSINPHELLEEALRLVRQGIPSTVKIEVETEKNLPTIAVNRTSFVQVALNLATNAAAAMQGAGLLRISLKRISDDTAERIAGKPPSFIEMRVTDTGCGMNKEVLDRAFEPFFTTKDVGQGTGLGLSVVFGLITEMHGRIVIASEPGLGTTVTVLLPCE